MHKMPLVVAFFICVFVMPVCAVAESQPKEFKPKKAEVDSNYDGVVDRIEFYDSSGQIVKVESDTTGDGKIDEWLTYKSGEPANIKKDTNADGKPDVWMEY